LACTLEISGPASPEELEIECIIGARGGSCVGDKAGNRDDSAAQATYDGRTGVVEDPIPDRGEMNAAASAPQRLTGRGVPAGVDGQPQPILPVQISHRENV